MKHFDRVKDNDAPVSKYHVMKVYSEHRNKLHRFLASSLYGQLLAMDALSPGKDAFLPGVPQEAKRRTLSLPGKNETFPICPYIDLRFSRR